MKGTRNEMAQGFIPRSESAKRAERLVAERLRHYGFDVYETGIEHWDDDAGQQLYDRLRELASLKQPGFGDVVERWRLEQFKHAPDLLAYHPHVGIVPVEVKSRSRSYRNFSMDEAVPRSHQLRELLNSLPAAIQPPDWMLRPHVVAFVDLSVKPPSIHASWDHQLPHIDTIKNPQGDGEIKKRLKTDWPSIRYGAMIIENRAGGGSQNPYVLVPDRILIPFDEFVEQELLGLPADWRDYDSA
jgi:hypothetical protein